MNVTVVGSGYVGLVSGVCLTSLRHNVRCLDIDAARVATINSGISPVFEPGLEELLHEALAAGSFAAHTDVAAAMDGTDLVMVAVGTPDSANGGADLSQVKSAVTTIAPHLTQQIVIVTKSTVPVGTNAWIRDSLVGLRPDLDIQVASNPEFLRQGRAVQEFLEPDRIVIGADNDATRERVADLYRPLEERGVPLYRTDLASAEIIKYAANAFLAMKIAFINEIADLCEVMDGDVEHVATAMGMDQRIGAGFLSAGPGFGGSCFPKDTAALAHSFEIAGIDASLVRTASASNSARRRTLGTRVLARIPIPADQATVAVLGATFKAGTDDVRDSPAVDLMRSLSDAGASVRFYDPKARVDGTELGNGVERADDPMSAIEGADAAVIATEWEEFVHLDLAEMKRLLAHPVVIDLRNVLDRERARAAGLEYWPVGRPAVHA